MKTIYVIFFLILSVAGLSAFTGRAVPHPVQENISGRNTLSVLDYTPLPQLDISVSPSELPRCVRASVVGKYAAYVIGEAFWGHDGLYKLVLKKEKAKMTVYCNEEGVLIKKGPIEWDQSVILK